MVTDMVRNDLARVAAPGSVRVARLFAAERFATLWQLTSSVVAHSAAPLAEVLRALFPSASITGAPKASTMRLIAELEGAPRGVYTGAVGWMGPGRRVRFAVAIRTVWIDRGRGVAEYGTGGGITWGSSAALEHAEGRLKARVLSAPPPPAMLLETLRWTPGRGYWLLPEHLARLRDSAALLGFAGSAGAAAVLEATASRLPSRPHRVRLLLARDGTLTTDAEPLALRPRHGWRVALAAAPVERGDAQLFHKRADRTFYDAMRAACPGCDDVLLWNREGELTESTRANLVLRLDGALVTPALDCGLLPGTLRARLLARGRVREAVLPLDALGRASGVWLVNSLRGWVPVQLAGV
jgi:para-aminobenzoate synthetase/4-amino-4-deoxychorismate lyase